MAKITILGFLSVFVIDYAVSGQTGILSSLYKKAAQENRPMILVLDNNDNANKNGNNLARKQDYRENGQKPWPYNIVQSGTSHHHGKNQPDSALDHDHHLRSRFRSQTQIPSRLRNRDRKFRLRSGYDDRYSQDDRDYRNDRDRRNRNRYSKDRRDRNGYDRRDRDRNDRDRRGSDRDDRSYDRDRRDRDDRDRRDRYRDDRRDRDRDDRRDRYWGDYDNRDKDRYYSDKRYRDYSDRYRDDTYYQDQEKGEDRPVDRTLRALIDKNLKDDPDVDPKTRALKASVVKSLLRAANDLNCDAKDECQSDCGGKKKDACEDKCDKDFKCDEGGKDDGGCDGDGGDECGKTEEDDCANGGGDCGGDDDNENPSTRGVLLEEEESKGCPRC